MIGALAFIVQGIYKSVKKNSPSLKNKRELEELQRNIREIEHFRSQIIGSRELFTLIAEEILNSDFKPNEEIELLNAQGCRLIEVRKGAKLSVRNSTYSGRSSSGSIRVGRIRVGSGTYFGSGSSESISFPAPDELQQIDNGRFIATTRRVSFSGSMFTRTTELKKIISSESQGLQTLISSVSSSKVWICGFDDFAYQWITKCIFELSRKSPGKHLFDGDTFETEQSCRMFRLITEDFAIEIDSLISQTKSELDALYKSLIIKQGGTPQQTTTEKGYERQKSEGVGRSDSIPRQPAKMPTPADVFLRKRSSLLLIDPGSKKIEVIKAVQQITNCGLKQGKLLIDNPPSVIADQLDDELVRGLHERLVRLGALTEIF